MYDIHVHTDTLRQSAANVQSAAEQVGPATGHWLDASYTAAGTMTGWESGSALKECTDSWQPAIKTIVDQLNDYAQKLHDSAHCYDQAEQEANRRLTAALTDLHANGS